MRQPVGVCAAIVPFNFPAMVPFWFLPFAIACGNAFILKPSEQVPLTQQIAFEVLDSLDLPPGVVNLVNGGREVVEGILEHPGIDAVSFVGSAPVARIVYERAAATGKRVQALGGAKNHMVVMPDAVIDRTVAGIIGSAFGAAGQRCMAGSVVVTVGEAQRAPARRRCARPPRRCGWATAPTRPPTWARWSRPTARDRILGGDRPRRWPRAPRRWWTGARPGRATRGGAFVGPTILTGVRPDMEAAREEIFGPVLSIVHVDTLDEAIDVVNGSRFGNGTSIFTESGASVRRYRHEVEAGMVGVNIGVAAPVAFFPFSGWKDSFLGRPARARPRRGRVLHPQEDRDEPLVLERPGRRAVLRRDARRSARQAQHARGAVDREPLAAAGDLGPAVGHHGRSHHRHRQLEGLAEARQRHACRASRSGGT